MRGSNEAGNTDISIQVTIRADRGTLPDFLRKVSIPMNTAGMHDPINGIETGYEIVGADADTTKIYLLVVSDMPADVKVLVFTREGVLESFVSLPYDDDIHGLVKLSNGFAYSHYTTRPTISIVGADGSPLSTYSDRVAVSLPGALVQFANTNFASFRGSSGLLPFANVYTLGGDYVSTLRIKSSRAFLSAFPLAAALTADKAYVFFDPIDDDNPHPNPTQIHEFTVQFTDLDRSSDPRIDTGESIKALAGAGSQLIVVMDEKFYFYGMDPAIPSPIPKNRQLFGLYDYMQSYWVATGAGNFALKLGSEERMVEEWALRELAFGSDRTVQQQTQYIKLIPEFVLGDVEEGDIIFVSEDEPAARPTERFFTVQGIIYAAQRRQTFLCTYTG